MKQFEYSNFQMIIEQDKDPKPCSEKAKKFHTLFWPAQSPVLNPFEHFWNHLGTNGRRSKPTFDHALKAKFYSIDKNFCKKPVNSLSNR